MKDLKYILNEGFFDNVGVKEGKVALYELITAEHISKLYAKEGRLKGPLAMAPGNYIYADKVYDFDEKFRKALDECPIGTKITWIGVNMPIRSERKRIYIKKSNGEWYYTCEDGFDREIERIEMSSSHIPWEFMRDMEWAGMKCVLKKFTIS